MSSKHLKLRLKKNGISRLLVPAPAFYEIVST